MDVSIVVVILFSIVIGVVLYCQTRGSNAPAYNTTLTGGNDPTSTDNSRLTRGAGNLHPSGGMMFEHNENNPIVTHVFTPDDVLKDNIPIASVSKLVLACIYHMHTTKHPQLLEQYITPFEDMSSLRFNVDELLHMKGGIPFSSGGNTEEDVMTAISVLKDYEHISKPVTYSNVTYMLLAMSLDDLVGVNYIDSLGMLSRLLKIDNTWSCPIWKPGSGDIVSIKADMLKIGRYVQDHFDWFADDLNHTCYRGRGLDVVSSNTELLNVPGIDCTFGIKDGSQGVPMVEHIDFELDGVPAKYYSSGEIKHTCRLIIPKKGDVQFINSLTDIHPFTYPLIPDHRMETPTFDPTVEFCIDLFGSAIEVGDSVEILYEPSYQVFRYDSFDTEPMPEWVASKDGRVDITEVTFIGRSEFNMPATVEVVHDRFLRFDFSMNYFGESKHFHPLFIVDNIKHDVIYLRSPFERAERPYARLERAGMRLVWYTP